MVKMRAENVRYISRQIVFRTDNVSYIRIQVVLGGVLGVQTLLKKINSQNFAQLPQSTNNTQTTTTMMNVLNHNILDKNENKNEKCTRNFVM